MKFLSKVADTFWIPGRGAVILPEEPQDDFRIRAMTVVQLRAPDGSMLDTHIAAIEILKTDRGARMGIMLPREIAKEDVPRGSEIWYAPEA